MVSAKLNPASIMTQNKKKNLPTWTDKHDAFCLKNKLTSCAKLLWQWLIGTSSPKWGLLYNYQLSVSIENWTLGIGY